MILWVATTA